MRYVICLFVTTVWALWLGALVALFLFVIVLFRDDRNIAVQAAPMLFATFERYQLILAAATLVGAVFWRMLVPSRLIIVFFALLALAAMGATASTALITPKMQELRKQGQSSGPEFKSLHARSSMIYTIEAGLVLSAGAALPIMIGRTLAGRSLQSETAPDTAAA